MLASSSPLKSHHVGGKSRKWHADIHAADKAATGEGRGGGGGSTEAGGEAGAGGQRGVTRERHITGLMRAKQMAESR